jgi:transposase
MKSYSNDLRRKIVAAYETGDYSQDEIAELFGVCQKSVSNFSAVTTKPARPTSCRAAADAKRNSTSPLAKSSATCSKPAIT